jgi:hypothetical protein
MKQTKQNTTKSLTQDQTKNDLSKNNLSKDDLSENDLSEDDQAKDDQSEDNQAKDDQPKEAKEDLPKNILLKDALSVKSRQILQSPDFSDKICLFARFWNIEDCKESPDSLFIFGDNDQSKGIGGQAVIRNCVNSMGIPTKKFPSYHNQAYYTDREYNANCKKILTAVDRIIIESAKYKEIVFPLNGFGTGLSRLPEKAPKTLKYINDLLEECFDIEYESIQKNGICGEIEIKNETLKKELENYSKNNS